MSRINIGHDADTKEPVHLPLSSFDTHWHLIGGTGKGKTTAITSMLHKLLIDPLRKDCFIIIDRMGSFSQNLLMWMASPFCTQTARDRLIYFEAGREDIVLPFNPLIYDTQAHGHFKVCRATEVVLRGWDSQNIEAMPRLARWIFNAFWSAAQLGLTISDCTHFLMPGSPFHQPLIECLPEPLQVEWSDLRRGGGSEISRILESARNRLKPYFENDILRRMFGGSNNHLDILRFMREGKILIVNLAQQNRISPQVADAIGGLIINEVLATARSLPGHIRYPTYLWLDEFQRFVGPDLEEAIPEVRQLGLKLILAHQSLSQLKRGDYDMTSLIFQAQSRMVFGVQGEDADALAHEFATIEFDPRRIKDEFYSRRQLHKGHRMVELASRSQTHGSQNGYAYGESTGENVGEGRNRSGSIFDDNYRESRSDSESQSRGHSRQESNSSSSSDTVGHHQTLVPTYDEFLELSTRTYVPFNEQRTEWAQKIRRLKRGCELMRMVDDDRIREVEIKRSAPGFLGFDLQTIHRQFPQAIEDFERLIEHNFQNELFCSPAEIDADASARLQRILCPRLPAITSSPENAPKTPDPFC